MMYLKARRCTRRLCKRVSPLLQLHVVGRSFSSFEFPKKSTDRSLTHAHLIETAQILSPRWKHLSPCLGAALVSSPFCGNMLTIGKVNSSTSTQDSSLLTPPANLATLLLFQANRHQPVRLTRSRSMVAAHLTPRLIGTILAMELMDEPPIEQILRSEGIKSNHVHNEWTGVSLKRWKDLITSSSLDDTSLIIPLWLNALWETSRDKSCLLDFLLAMERTTQQSILNNDELGNALRHDPSAQREWASKTFDPKDLKSGAVVSLSDLMELPMDDPAWSRALEVTCASMAVQHADKPAILAGKYGYDGGDPKSDCVEMTVRELFDLLLWDESTGSFDLSRLPPTASQELHDLYEQQQHQGHGGGGERWFRVLSNLPRCDYLSVSPNGKPYELTPTLANVAQVTNQLLGVVGEHEQPLRSLDSVSQLWENNKIIVSARLSRHPSTLGEDVITQEVATVFLEGGKNGIEMRLDKAHGICTVTHLRAQNTSLDEQSLMKLLVGSMDDLEPSLKTLALAMIGDRGLMQDSSLPASSDELVFKLLSTPFGPDRRDLLHVVGTPDLARRDRDVKRALQESQQVLCRALSEICTLEGEEALQRLLLLWILRETPAIIDDESIIRGQRHDPMVEKMILALPDDLLGDDSIQEALQSNWAVRGKMVIRLAQLQLGTLPLSHKVVNGLSVGEIWSLLSLYARSSLTSKQS